MCVISRSRNHTSSRSTASNQYFGYASFRPSQKEVIDQILDKRDCLAVMATGSGNYQVPPLLLEKTAIVISPLISLMQDQVMSLKQRGIRAEFLGSAQTDGSVHTKAQSGHFHLLFMTPEKACSTPLSFWLELLEAGICLFAVDEAHCISEWGHDFRVEYKQLHKLRDVLLDVPFVGLTATATENVRIDIINSLKMNNPYVAVGSFDRKNLFYGVKHFNRSLQFVDELVQEISKYARKAGSTIIYCTTIKDVEQIHKSLQEAGIKTGIYHGQMSSKAREESHRSFIKDELLVMVATIAFGMGIDKPNIRQVIHYGCPKSIESYYQESGRCGRDGIPSVCWLYYTRADFAKADFYCGGLRAENQRRAVMESLLAAQHYCSLTTCRRKFLLSYFGEKSSAEKCGNCDNCMVSKRERDMSKESFLLMSCIQSCQGYWGLNMPVDVLRGSRAKKILNAHFDKLPFHGLGKDYSSNWWKSLAYQLISHGYLMETFRDTYKFVRVSPKGEKYIRSARPDHQPALILPLTDEMVEDEEQQCTTGEVGELNSMATLECEQLSEAEAQIFHMLLDERTKLAKSIGTAPYAVCGDQTIKKIALARPSTKARLANIDGVNQHLVVRHGDYLLQTIRQLSQELNLSLDGGANLETANTRKANLVPHHKKKLTPAKFDAWKLWHENGLPIQKIANFPGRSAPIKEGTVVEYLLEAAQGGLQIEWTRLCDEVELSRERLSEIEGAISKVGSREKLKPIKDELPEDISYAHIKICLAMQDCGLSPEVTLPSHLDTSKADEFVESESGMVSTDTSCSDKATHCCSDHNETASLMVRIAQDHEVHPIHDANVLSTRKRQKVGIPEESSTGLEATESSILDWLKNYDEGVFMRDILEHFNGSKEELVIDLLGSLESDFIIFKKNDLYMLL
uniref:ATP-dependent DNA helicase n=1 Tax=Salix viminalis TaxID=40686 RepID=A0A6N2M002_SALVM